MYIEYIFILNQLFFFSEFHTESRESPIGKKF